MSHTEQSAPRSASPSNPDGVTGKLSTWIHATRLEDVPEEVITRAKFLILDGLACAMVGAKLPWSQKAVQALSSVEGSGDGGKCSLFGWGAGYKLSPLTATLLNSSFIQGFELDDYHSTAPLHTNSLLLPALFAAAESLPADAPVKSGRDFLQAYIVGCEVGPRVGLALHGADLLTRGWHSGAVQGPSAVAAAASNFLGLTAQQTEWAQGSACTQAGGLMSAQFGSMAKRMQHGFAARSGLTAALLARQDYTGIEEVYERPYGGFLSCFGQGANYEPKTLPEKLVDGLGSTWELHGIRVKLHAAMAALHGSIDCADVLQKTHPKLFEAGSLDSIKEISTEHAAAAYEHGGWIAPPDEPLVPTAAQMSIQYAVAAQLLDGEVQMGQFSEARLNRPAIRKIMAKVKPFHQGEFDANIQTGWKTAMTVRFDDGVEVKTDSIAPRGIKPPASNEDVRQKWRKLAATVASEQWMDQVESLVMSLESLDEIRKLSKMLGEFQIEKSPIS